ncbi:TerD family protein [Nakamurella endophytica]|nr:tellurium resistance protein [Nakamurella endophytica]
MQQPPAAAPASPAGPGVSLRKVSLTTAAPSVSLSKTGGSSGIIRVNLNWSSGAPATSGGGGFFKRLAAAAGARGVDLDLGCLWELADGSKGVVQALGNSFGSLDRPPYIQLDGDDRSGSVATGENMSISLQPGRFRRILIFAMIYEGAPNWAAVDGVVTLTPIAGPQIEVRMDATSNQSRICAVAQLLDQRGDLVVQREVRYIDGGQSVLDRQYGWGMNWTPGRK